jgi:hypothetical protein
MVPKTSGPGTTALVRQREPGLSQVQFIRHTDYGIDGRAGCSIQDQRFCEVPRRSQSAVEIIMIIEPHIVLT